MDGNFFTSGRMPSYERDVTDDRYDPYYEPMDTLSEEDKQAIEDLYEEGMYPEDIAQYLELDETEVMIYCEELLGEE